MTSLLSCAGWYALSVLGALAAVALLMALLLSPWMVRQWWIGRQLRPREAPLPGHTPGPVGTSRRHRRQLHRDLVLLLVLNTDRADKDA